MKIEFNNLYTHFVFITYKRQPVIPEKNRIRIERYITPEYSGLKTTYQDAMPFMPTLNTSTYWSQGHQHYRKRNWQSRALGNSSEKFINENKLVAGHFTWQESAAAFSVSKSGIDKVCKYILNQPEHHKNEGFAQEYEHFLACPDPSGKFYQANYKVNKVGLWVPLSGY